MGGLRVVAMYPNARSMKLIKMQQNYDDEIEEAMQVQVRVLERLDLIECRLVLQSMPVHKAGGAELEVERTARNWGSECESIVGLE